MLQSDTKSIVEMAWASTFAAWPTRR